MRCPYCDNNSTGVLDSRVLKRDHVRVRKRVCLLCRETFLTEERVRTALPRVAKRDKRREPFDLKKLRNGIETALHKRPFSADAVDELVDRIAQGFRRGGYSEVQSSEIGDAVMFYLHEMDPVAYIRFASVYKSSVNPEQFGDLAKMVKRTPHYIATGQLTLPFVFGTDDYNGDKQE